ncbi:MAG: pyruvate synthase subunit beta [Deltaproteobacteria bacterium]|nr:pyruvate synthase subunit beta [Deltaproteobacteria bacterium]
MLKKFEEIRSVEAEYMLPGGRSCIGCSGGILTRMTMKAVGPNTIASTGSCGTNTTGMFPVGAMSTFPVPVSILGGCGAALAGMEIAAKVKGREDATILGIVGDGDAADIGFGSLSACFERGHKVLVVVQDNQGYAATGGQRSGTTPLKAWTRSTPEGKARPPKYLPLIMLAHGAPYVATCSVAYPEDIFEKVRRATRKENQPALIHCITPCPTNWKNEPRMSVEVARQAVTCGMWPLWEYERGTFRRTAVGKPTAVEDYLKLQGRFRQVTGEDVEEIRAYIADLNRAIDRAVALYADPTAPPWPDS